MSEFSEQSRRADVILGVLIIFSFMMLPIAGIVFFLSLLEIVPPEAPIICGIVLLSILLIGFILIGLCFAIPIKIKEETK